MGPTFQGVSAESTFGNRLRMNFTNIGTGLNEAIDEYNRKIDLYESEIKKEEKTETPLESGKIR